MNLVIVESPTKAKTIRKFLGPDYHVLASMGHVRDLPQSADEVPEAYRKTEFGQLGVNVEKDFEPLYVVPKTKTKTISELKKALKQAQEVYLATDEDREGESISWHLLQVLKPNVPVHRMVFHEITNRAIDEALKHPRGIDENLVRAQEARRILDRLVGYTISPVLWKKIAYGLSAGRVQSAALKAIVDRERQRMAFRKASYFDVSAALEQDAMAFEARLTHAAGKRIATGRDFDEETGVLKTKNVQLLEREAAEAIARDVKAASWSVSDVAEKPITRRPPPPFITSTLQQEANRKLGLTSKETMRVAQSLYENGFITYMRTDSVALAHDAIIAARKLAASRYGADYVPEVPRVYTSTSKGAQEAHEAIRPSLNFTPPNEIGLSGSEHALYELIWMRTMASQMTDSRQQQLAVTLDAAGHTFQANGLKILFPGFLRAYAEAHEDAEQALAERERLLPSLAKGDGPECRDAKPDAHETKPAARYTEAGLVQYMEKEDIGRPSTYATVISTLMDRGYVRKSGAALVPTFTAFAVTQLLEDHFHDLVDAKFTSRMEESLDRIAEGKEQWIPYLRDFYLSDHGLKRRIEEETGRIDPDEARVVRLPGLEDVTVRVGKFGPYFEATHPKSGTSAKASVPPDVTPSDFTKALIDELLHKAQQGPTTIGQDPETGLNIFLRTGSYGPYLQLGQEVEGSKQKPKRVSIPKNIPLETLDREKALQILSLPRLLGTHPETGKEVRAGLGRFGPYVVHEGDFRSLKGKDDVLTVALDRALELFAVPKGTRGGKVLRELGKHPKDKKPVRLCEGKYGLYVKHGRMNASVPKTVAADDVKLSEAVKWFEARKSKKKSS